MNTEKVHFVGVGGVGMGSLAIALKQAGFYVSGSDGKIYEPMKSSLLSRGIELIEGYHFEITERLKPDRVVIGNVVRKDNIEVTAWLKKGVSFCSFPEAVRRYLIENKTSIICSGTHGKTTTTAWVSFLLSSLKQNPSYLIGGVPTDLTSSSLMTDSQYFVGEGDEYDSAFFDKGPKFLHYDPTIAIIANIEFDHADIYRDLNHVKESFEKLASLLPGNGVLVANYQDPHVMEIAQKALCPVQTFGFDQAAMWRIVPRSEKEEGIVFEIFYKGKSLGLFQTPLFGQHNLMNLASGICAVANCGFSIEKIRECVPKFHGVRRRLELLKKNPFMLYDDFAHHPTEVKATTSAVKSRYPDRRLISVFEPRSATARRNIHQREYLSAFESVDIVILSEPFKAGELREDEKLSVQQLVQELRRSGKEVYSFANSLDIIHHLEQNLEKEDIVLVMSNGEFDKIQSKIAAISL